MSKNKAEIPYKVLTHKDFKYIVIQSGYTARLVNTFGFVYYENVENNYVPTKTTHKVEKKYDPTFGDNCENCDNIFAKCSCLPNPMALFIYDNVWGQGLYSSKDFDTEMHKYAIEILTEECDEGFIVFIDPEITCQTLQNYDYCHWVGVIDTGIIVKDKKNFAMIYKIDSESG